MAVEELTIVTDDGDCPLQVFTPDRGHGPWSAVIVYMDAGGVRPAMSGIARRIANAGFLALLPDLFYRFGSYGPFDPVEVFAGDFRATLGPLIATTDNLKAARDTGALLSFLDTRSDVACKRVGAVGFCMGGGMAITAAAKWPDRFSAVASFHGGRLATGDPSSPHLFVDHLEAEVYVAAARDDASYPPEMAGRLEAALDQSNIRHHTESFPAAHGWMMPDFPVYDRDQAERGWTRMLDLFDRTLRGGGVRRAQGAHFFAG